ncbi:MAG: hypothetical protein LBF41_09810 [Deltaproteobacteria bacterium]|jgi:hypothetical protein|nr:hypothetical protein [Deltaproteobacteria bacterium]
MTKTFNIDGPSDPSKHYALPLEDRQPEMDAYISLKRYFVIHGPRSGKTSFSAALAKRLHREKLHYCLLLGLKPLEGTEDVDAAMGLLCSLIKESLLSSDETALKNAAKFLPAFEPDKSGCSFGGPSAVSTGGPSGGPLICSWDRSASPETESKGDKGDKGDKDEKDDKSETDSENNDRHVPLKVTTALSATLKTLVAKLDRSLVLVFDDLESLAPEVFSSFLRQLRAGYILRRVNATFPRSVILLSREKVSKLTLIKAPAKNPLSSEPAVTANPYNIFTKFVSINNFSREEIAALLDLWSKDTGRAADVSAAERAFHWTKGEPFLVNAMAKEATEKVLGKNSPLPLRGCHMDVAAKSLLENHPELF